MKEMKMFIRAEFEDCNSGRAYQKALRTVPSVRSQATVTYFFFFVCFETRLDAKWHGIDSLHIPDLTITVMGYVTLCRIKKECYLLTNCPDDRRKLLFMVQQVFLPMGKFWLMYNADTWSTVQGERRSKGRGEFLCWNFTCLSIKYEFYFTASTPYSTF